MMSLVLMITFLSASKYGVVNTPVTNLSVLNSLILPSLYWTKQFNSVLATLASSDFWMSMEFLLTEQEINKITVQQSTVIQGITFFMRVGVSLKNVIPAKLLWKHKIICSMYKYQLHIPGVRACYKASANSQRMADYCLIKSTITRIKATNKSVRQLTAR